MPTPAAAAARDPHPSPSCPCEQRCLELSHQISKLSELVDVQQRTISLLENRIAALEGSSCLDFGRPSSYGNPIRPATNKDAFQSPPLERPLSTFVGRPSTSDDVTALESDDLFRLVESCALDFLRSNPTLRQGEWCTDCEGPCTSFKLPEEPTATQQNPETTTTVSTVNVAGEPVAVEELVSNPALQFLLQNPKKNGRWCKGHPEATTSENCTFVHRKKDAHDQTLLVEGTPVPIGALVRNKAVEMLLTHPVSSEGQWCHSDDATHDVTICYRVHRRDAPSPATAPHTPAPTAVTPASSRPAADSSNSSTSAQTVEYVLVADSRVPVSELCMNPAVEYLTKNPTKRGRWCSLPKDHDAAQCTFVHSKAGDHHLHNHSHSAAAGCPDAAGDAATTDTDDKSKHGDEASRCVRVGPDLVPVTKLARNPAVDYLLANPHRRGRWCHGHGEKQIQECTFVHTTTDALKDASATSKSRTSGQGSTSNASGSASSNGAAETTLTTRMVVYYEADTDASM